MKNVGGFDRVLRLVVGLVLIAVPFVMAAPESGIVAFGAFGWVMVAAGLVALLTAAFGFCPLYRVLGVQTCSVCSKTAN